LPNAIVDRLRAAESGTATLDPGELLRCVGPYDDLPFRARYNLACYHSIRGARLLDSQRDQAMKFFRQSLADLRVVAAAGDRALLAGAARDPSLKGVRDNLDEFWVYIPRPRPQAHRARPSPKTGTTPMPRSR
jgi:hypothetical protein